MVLIPIKLVLKRVQEFLPLTGVRVRVFQKLYTFTTFARIRMVWEKVA